MIAPRPRGWLLLALVAVARMAVSDSADMGALWVMSAAGAFLAALPGRIRHRKEPRQRSTWQGCIACFVSGFAMVLAAALGHVCENLAEGIMQGVASAWAFGVCAWAAAFAVAHLGKGRLRV